MGTSYHEFCVEDALQNGESKVEVVSGWPIILCRSDDKYFAVLNRCSHAESSFEGGRVRRGMIACPLHGARFKLESGQCFGAAYRPLKTFDVRVEGGRVQVAVPDENPDSLHAPVRTTPPR